MQAPLIMANQQSLILDLLKCSQKRCRTCVIVSPSNTAKLADSILYNYFNFV